ncbi:hypothetical protein [Bacillus sp. 1NLA3E]|uniref:hypothetical protein n=1 Tax=Bacillus sp. 1NLA3E TaxID=666686 RepID=UPI000247EAF8|nr:hypothetical protein [Bacillus sp. 1NLA3E]AGK53175.1 hypothetical protein B1NLA3E_07055 [Bacillus sp. 1NLA3E]
MELLNSLIYLTKSSTLRKLSGEPKILYKYSIAATFYNIINGKQLQVGQFVNLEIARDILKNPKKSSESYDLAFFKKQVHDSLRRGHFHNPDSKETVDIIFGFFREKLEGLKVGKRFWKGSEFEKIISLNEFFKGRSGPIKEHHWIDFNIQRGLIPTIPDLITYFDLINSWNWILERHKRYSQLAEEQNDGLIARLDFLKNEEGRKILYEIFSLQRICYTSCVTFVESYLFNLFYNFKSNQLFADEGEISDLYKLHERNVNDTHVMEKIIFPKFLQEDSQSNKRIKELYTEFLEVNKVRNAIIHTTSYEDKSNQRSFMEMFFEVNLEKVEKAMNNSVEFVLLIDQLLPHEHKLLYWWDKFETPDFSKRKKISTINPDSNLSKLTSI